MSRQQPLFLISLVAHILATDLDISSTFDVRA